MPRAVPGLCPAPLQPRAAGGEAAGPRGGESSEERAGSGSCWSRAALSTWSLNSQKLNSRTRVSLSAACQDTPGTPLSSCFPDFKHHGLFLLYFSTLFCVEKLRTPRSLPRKSRQSSSPRS